MPMTILNAAVAEGLNISSDLLEELLTTQPGRDQALMELIKKLYNDSKDILFGGNNYSSNWREEALRRGLPFYPTTAEALALRVYALASEGLLLLVATLLELLFLVQSVVA